MDATYRSDLRALNELNFSRFDAKLEQRVTDLDAKLEQRMTRLEAKLEQRVLGLETKLEQLRGEFRRDLGDVKADLIKWMFAFWAPTALAVVALLLRK